MLWRDTLNGVSRQFYSPLGEFYCFAVIFGLRRVIFASRVLEANRISLKPQGFNITIAISDNITPTKSEYNSCFLCRFVI